MKKYQIQIAIIGYNPPNVYSGGRYHALMMAEALVHAGHEVVYITNNKPIFLQDFVKFPKHNQLTFCITKDFNSDLPNNKFDIIIMIPHKDRNPAFFISVEKFVKKNNSRFVTINFETPNWLNSMAPKPFDFKLWEHWRLCCKSVQMILSSTRISKEYAIAYFTDINEFAIHRFCYPSINSIVADSVREKKAEKRIVIFARFQDAHKGLSNPANILCDAMKGYSIVFIIGASDNKPETLKEFEQFANSKGICLEYLFKINDIEKFKQIKRSSLVLFPSFFEGFGYPPIEAQYCNVPCIAFDLPVLREVCDDGIYYVEPGNWKKYRKKISEILGKKENHSHLRRNIERTASFNEYVVRINNIVNELMEQKPIGIKRESFWKNIFNVTVGVLYLKAFSFKVKLHTLVARLKKKIAWFKNVFRKYQ